MQEASPTPSPSKPNNSEDEDETWDSWEELSCEFDGQESSDSCESKDESTGENQFNMDVQAQPSFEVLQEFPLSLNSDFLKIKEDVLPEQQTTFDALRNMNSNQRSCLEMNRVKMQNAKWLPSPIESLTDKYVSTPKKIKEDMRPDQQTTFDASGIEPAKFPGQFSNQRSCLEINRMKMQNGKWLPSPRELFADKHVSTPKIEEKRKAFERKNRKFDGVDFAAGLAIGIFATNAFAFVLGFSLGWFSRDSVPTLVVYEYYMDPTVM